MKGLKVAELVIAAISTLATIAKGVMKLIDYISRLRRKSIIATA